MSIPTDWTSTPVGDVADFVTGFPFSSAGFTSSGVRLVRGSNVKRGEIDWSAEIVRFWSAPEYGLRTFELRDGDVVIAMDGALVGRSYARISRADLPAYLVQRVARLRGRSVDQGLLYQWIGSEPFVRHVDDRKTHTAIPHISPADIREFTLTIPESVPEQQRIAAALAEADDLVAALERMIAKKQAIKQGMMQQLLTGKTRLPGFNAPWREAALGDHVQIAGGGTPSRSVTAYWGGSIPWATVKDVSTFDPYGTQEYVTPLGIQKSAARLVRAGTPVLVTRMLVGKAVRFRVDVAINQDLKSLVTGSSIDPAFLCHWFEAFGSKLAASAGGSTVAGTSTAQIKTLVIELPEIEEQRAISLALDDSAAELERLRVRLTKARDVKQGMMQELLTGRARLSGEEGVA